MSDLTTSNDPTDVRVIYALRQPAERVFNAWLIPDQAGKWLFATDTGQMLNAEIDARVGGTFRFVDHRNGEDVEHVGEYIVIERPHRLVFDFAVPKYSALKTRVAVEIEAQGTGCVLSLTHAGVPEEYAERTHTGWMKILNGLSASLAPLH
ncbi:SRPBCC family protein [Uliginosibacterium sp. H3]|uniref:SRPBCC family protein n=1 Tax=Uliginosibacterium silvisoli TaxID=3114758 RepID=A0ABU6JZ84_9RHOO|nr:SRPBCC family protein [Uliginosibacterium sp. H3]